MRQIGPGKFSSRVVYPMLGIALLLTLACGASASPTGVLTGSELTEPTQARAEPSGGAVAVEVGNKVGQQIVDFNITLIDGTRVTSVELLAQRQPTFLFFFETW
ncbi:MAG: hypothetical protein IIB31_10325 [Chloroflexi bacterium]|nr:hypothetical protein [Chloroflexota bacterium]